MAILPHDLTSWLSASATQLDICTDDAPAILPALADAGLFRVGVSASDGGRDGDVADAVAAIAAVSEESLAAGFVFWGHRAFIEYLLQSPNEALRQRLLPDLLAGRRAGATALSNAMKFLAGIEELQIKAREIVGSTSLSVEGKMPWVTNLRPEGFDVAAAIEGPHGRPAFIAVLSSEDEGIVRSDDLDLMAMRGSNTAAVDVRNVEIGPDRILHVNASEWLPRVRPAFLGLQCGMSIGLAHRAIRETEAKLKGGRDVLSAPCQDLIVRLRGQETLLNDGLRSGRFVEQAAALFHIRIALAEIAAEALQLELQASGGRAYLAKPGEGCQRRLREVAFIPLITPSIVQLKTVLQTQQRAQPVSEVA